MKQYLDLCQRIVDQGVWVDNKRTGKRCLTVIDADLTYNVKEGEFPLVTTRKSSTNQPLQRSSDIFEGMIAQQILDSLVLKHGMLTQTITRTGSQIPTEKARMTVDLSTEK